MEIVLIMVMFLMLFGLQTARTPAVARVGATSGWVEPRARVKDEKYYT